VSFEPRIVGVLCNWCSYAGADLAGISRIQYPPNIRVVRVMCSGRVDPRLVVEALLSGADGVLALGCHIGDCHYQSGNLEAREKFEPLKALLAQTASEGRFDYDWVSASEAQRFALVVTQFTDKIRSMGPAPSDEAARRELRAVLREAGDFRTRWLVGRTRRMGLEGDAYGQPVDPKRWQVVLDRVLREQFVRALILERASESPVTVEELAELTRLDPAQVLRHVQRLRAKGDISIEGERDRSPLWVARGVVRP
jgi:coenzyme F420-reducing hydrogenase delta subunit